MRPFSLHDCDCSHSLPLGGRWHGGAVTVGVAYAFHSHSRGIRQFPSKDRELDVSKRGCVRILFLFSYFPEIYGIDPCGTVVFDPCDL
jgi:hypothetical protein